MNLAINENNVEVKISNERLKTVITVTGNVNAQSAREIIRKIKEDGLCDSLMIPDIIALPQGYRVNIFDFDRLKEKLDLWGMVDCCYIFSLCDKVMALYKKYGKEFFEDILFDYDAVFVAESNVYTLEVYFIYLPFLHNFGNRIRFTELIRVLYVHMRENDHLSENFITELLEAVTKWEVSGYDNDFLGNILFCIDSFKKNYSKDIKKDLFSKSLDVFKNFVSNKNTECDIMNDGMYVVTLTCSEIKKFYSFIFDAKQNIFYVMFDITGSDAKGSYCLKIGRDKSWADIHIPDMFVSGRFCSILFDGNCLYAQKEKCFKSDSSDILIQSGTVKLKNGSKISIGKNLYTVAIKPKNN